MIGQEGAWTGILATIISGALIAQFEDRHIGNLLVRAPAKMKKELIGRIAKLAFVLVVSLAAQKDAALGISKAGCVATENSLCMVATFLWNVIWQSSR